MWFGYQEDDSDNIMENRWMLEDGTKLEAGRLVRVVSESRRWLSNLEKER